MVMRIKCDFSCKLLIIVSRALKSINVTSFKSMGGFDSLEVVDGCVM